VPAPDSHFLSENFTMAEAGNFPPMQFFLEIRHKYQLARWLQ
jgi:hypothetical protein